MLDRKGRVRGIVVTHGHEDHTGAIDHVVEAFDAPIYATPLTSGLLEVKLSRAGLLNRTKLNTVRAGTRVTIGPFDVEFFHVCHSIPDGVGLGITTPAGLIVHSGDFKFDHTPVDGWPTDYAKLAEFSGRGVLALLSDSTNADQPGWTPSETVIDAAFDDLFRAAPGRILIGIVCLADFPDPAGHQCLGAPRPPDGVGGHLDAGKRQDGPEAGLSAKCPTGCWSRSRKR